YFYEYYNDNITVFDDYAVNPTINGTNDEIGSGKDYFYEYYNDNITVFDDYAVNPTINYSSKNDENGIISSTQNIFRNMTQNITSTSSDATSSTKMPNTTANYSLKNDENGIINSTQNITSTSSDVTSSTKMPNTTTNIIFTTVETNNIDGNLDLVKLLCLIGLFAAIVSVIFIFS
ncbi:hypothetical protein H312_02780, partial [Anncaliia algerae PRA339]